MQRIFQAYTTCFEPEEYYGDPYKFQAASNVLFPINQALSVKMGVNFMLFYMTLRTLGTDKHQPLVHDTMRRSCKSLFYLTQWSGASRLPKWAMAPMCARSRPRPPMTPKRMSS